ncbi:DoxX-like family protein [Pseudorhodoferax sp.]|uniref:DoxX-like family protein n=1 Tax=Pseudorhodoferax sp. TaxID=1993553 RepID=UPI002DD69AFA|nr:DoxX-like family protein [Pseudorhodoferax sp.]
MPSAERPAALAALRASLVFVWLATAVVSVVERDGQSAALLRQAGWTDPSTIHAVVLAGAGVDLLLGLAMALCPGRRVYWTALAAMALMTSAATLLLPGLWLHPLGPLTKNVPLAACLWLLLHEEARR